MWDTKQFNETVMHPSSYARKFSRKEFFWNTKVFSNKTFWYSQTKTFSPENLDITPFFVKKIFHSRSFLKQRMFPQRSFFGPVRKKNWQNCEASPLLCLENFDTRILSKHRRVLLRIISAQWDEKVSTEFSDIPFLWIKFWIPEIFWYTEMFPNVTFWYCETKNLNEMSGFPLFCIKCRRQWWNWCL